MPFQYFFTTYCPSTMSFPPLLHLIQCIKMPLRISQPGRLQSSIGPIGSRLIGLPGLPLVPPRHLVSLGSQHHQYLLGSQDELGSHRFQKACWKQWEPSSFWEPSRYWWCWEPREPRKTRQRGEAQGAQTGKAQEFKKMLTAQQAIMDWGNVRQRTVFYQKLSLSNS